MSERGQPGQIIGGRWRLRHRAGAGGEGTTWLAERVVGGAGRAVIKLRHVDTPETRLRFAREWAIASGVRHPRLVAALDYGDDENVGLWVALEVLGDSAWEAVQARGPLAAIEAAEAVCQLLEGIEALHAAGIVHRDVKPENLLHDPSTQSWKLADFGIAHLSGGEPLTDTATGMGTWVWSAPEQRYSARSVTAAADIYATGATLYGLLTGSLPFELHALHGESLPIRSLPSELGQVVFRATRLDPSERYASASDMRSAIRAALQGAPRAEPAQTLPQHRLRSNAKALSLGLVTLCSAVYILFTRSGRPGGATPNQGESSEPPPAAVLLLDAEETDARAGTALLVWTDPEVPAAPRVAVGAPGAGTGGRVLWVPNQRPGRGARTTKEQQEFGTTLAAMRPFLDEPRTFLVVGGPARDGHVYFYDPSDAALFGWTPPNVEELGPSSSGASIVDLGDAYGIGRAALVVGAPTAGQDHRGAVRIYLQDHRDVEHARIWGDQAGSALGSAMAAVDGDGDGIAELYSGAPGSGEGRVWRTLPYTSGELSVAEAADGWVRGSHAGEGFGAALAAAGDMDGDGAPELWVGAPRAADGAEDVGRVYLIPANWRGDAGAQSIGLATLIGATHEGDFGAVIAGDARPGQPPVGVAIGAPSEGGGVVRVYDTNLRGDVPAESATHTWVGGVDGGRFGASLVLDTDIDGDGWEDLLIGAPGEGNGRVWKLPSVR